MSLQIWLPFDGNLKNQGVLHTPIPTTSANFVDDGKVTSKCLKSSTKVKYDVSNGNISTHEMTVSFWGKSDTYTGTSTAWWQICSFNCNDNTAFHIYCVPNARYKMEYKPELNTYCDTNVWHHITYVLNGTKLTTYVDGVQSAQATVTNDNRILNSISIGVNTVNINDFRVYNHCLSPREIQYVAAGLIAHYPLKDGGIEATTNLAPYPTPGTAITPGWDVNLHPNAIFVSEWTSGYNSGVSNPSIGYHAYWKIIDGIPTIVFPDTNNTLSLGHRWLGISAGGFQKKIGPSTTYTISFDAKANVEGKKVSTGYYYRVTGASSNNFHDGKKSVVLTTAWKRYSFTFTTLNTLDTTIGASIYIYGYEDSIYGISYVRNVQVELKDHATPYTPTSRQAIVEDCSGYARHGEIVGNITINSNSSRYDQSIYQTDGRSNYIKTKTFTMPKDAVTMSCWFKSNTTGYNSYQIPLSFNSANYELSIDPSGHLRNGFTINGSRQVLTTSHSSILDDKWHMITATYDGKTIRRYLDGKELTSYATSISGTLAGGSSNLYIGTYNSGGYANKNAYMSDVRIYASALSAAAIETLYQSRIAFTEEKDAIAYEFIEDGLNHLKMTDKGLIHTGAISETMTAFNMPIKVLNDGSAWARIHWLDVTSNKTWFSNANEVAECLNQPNRYSRMGAVDQFKSTKIKITNLMPAVHTDNYSGGTADSTYRKYSNYSLKVTGKVETSESYIFTKANIPYIPGHTYYCCCNILQETIQGSSDMYWKIAEPYIMGGRKVSAVKTWTRVSAVRSAQSIINYAGSDWSAGNYQARWDYNNSKKEGAMWFDGFMLIDLTAAFGAGNEPTAAWCDQNIPYFTGSKQINFDNDTYGFYEFMLTYPRLSKTLYNRWRQSSSPNASTVTSFIPIETAWSAHNGGIRKYGSSCLYNCDTGSTWFAPIGQYGQWTTDKYIPAADGSTQTETELWIRIDTLSSEKRISLFDDKYIQALRFYEI